MTKYDLEVLILDQVKFINRYSVKAYYAAVHAGAWSACTIPIVDREQDMREILEDNAWAPTIVGAHSICIDYV